MLNFAQSRQVNSVSRKTSPATRIFAEGLALVADPSIDQGVAVSTGAAGEQFVGLSLASQIDPTQLPFYEEVASDANGLVTVGHQPVAGSLFVKDLVTGTVLTAAAAGTAQGTLTANQYALTASGAKTFVVPVARETNALLVGGRYSPTVADINWLQGDPLPGHQIANALNIVGVVTSGDLYTSEFDTTADWTAAAVYVKLSADGKFTATSTASEALPGVRLLSRPGFNNGFLGLSIGLNG